MELDVVAPLKALSTGERLLPPGLPTVMGDKQSPRVRGGVRHSGQIQVICVKRINGYGSNTARQTRALRGRQEPPRSAPICAEVQTNTRVRIGRKVCFASSTVEAIRVGRIKGEGADIQHGLLGPERPPGPASIPALPDSTTCGPGPEQVGIGRMHNHRGHATTDVGRSTLPPSSGCGYGRGRSRPTALFGKLLGRSFTIRPRRSRLKPGATALMCHESSACHVPSFLGTKNTRMVQSWRAAGS